MDFVANKKWTYATLMTSTGFSMGIETLIFTLFNTKPTAPLVVLFTGQVDYTAVEKMMNKYRNHIENKRLSFVKVNPIPCPANFSQEISHVEGWVNSGYTKLHIFNMIAYDKVVYIDADAIVLENVDELFQVKASFAAAPDIFPPDHFNAGVLVIQPDKLLFEDMISKISLMASYDGGDTGFLNAYFCSWYTSNEYGRLRFGYNAQRTMYWMVNEKNSGYWKAIKPLKIIHYSSNPKPWVMSEKKGDLEILWWMKYIESNTACL